MFRIRFGLEKKCELRLAFGTNVLSSELRRSFPLAQLNEYSYIVARLRWFFLPPSNLFIYLFWLRSRHLKFVPSQNSILISQRAARYICCIHPNLSVAGGLQVIRGSRPASFSWVFFFFFFCQTTVLIQNDCGCRAIPGWMGPAFTELQGPAVPLLS